MEDNSKNKVFISHSSRDYRYQEGLKCGKIIAGNVIDKIKKTLSSNNIDWWIDEDGLVSASGWCQQIRDAMNECNIFLYVSSHNSNKSTNTANEIAYALERRMHIIPFRIDSSDMHDDIKINLIRLHSLNYFLKGNVSLMELVETINGIRTTNVVSYNKVILPESLMNIDYYHTEISNYLLKLFDVSEIYQASEVFSSIIKYLDCDYDDGIVKLTANIEKLGRVGDMNMEVRHSVIVQLIANNIIEEDVDDGRFAILLKKLFNMFLHYCISDIPSFYKIQETVGKCEFKQTLMEKVVVNNISTINEVSRIAMAIGGVVAALYGHGTFGRAVAHSGTQSDPLNTKKIAERAKISKNKYEALKTIIVGLKIE